MKAYNNVISNFLIVALLILIIILVFLGKDSDLLIHEGSMEHGLQKDAIIKKHSTFTEAINVRYL